MIPQALQERAEALGLKIRDFKPSSFEQVQPSIFDIAPGDARKDDPGIYQGRLIEIKSWLSGTEWASEVYRERLDNLITSMEE